MCTCWRPLTNEIKLWWKYALTKSANINDGGEKECSTVLTELTSVRRIDRITYSNCDSMSAQWDHNNITYPSTFAKVKGKGFPYSLQRVGPGADPGVQPVSPQVTMSHPPGSRLPLHSARLAVTFPAAEHHRPLAGTKLYCLVAEAHSCEQLAQGRYAFFATSIDLNPRPVDRKCSTRCVTAPQRSLRMYY